MDGSQWTASAISAVLVLVIRETLAAVMTYSKSRSEERTQESKDQQLTLDRVNALISAERDRAVQRAEASDNKLDQIMAEYSGRFEHYHNELSDTKSDLAAAIQRIRALEEMLEQALGRPVKPWNPAPRDEGGHEPPPPPAPAAPREGTGK